jgi:NAD(P)H-dependent FMN reductase
MDEPLHLAVIIGSTRPGRLGPTVARWFVAQAEPRDDVLLDVIDLAELDLPAVLSHDPGPGVETYRRRLAAADGFVVVTPEYNHSFPAPLKQAIDLAHEPWHAKPVAFVSYGGISGGLRAVEQLRQVFAELHATTVRDTVSFHNPWGLFDEQAQTREAVGADTAAKILLDRLTWWAWALRTARRTEPYAA